MKSEPEISQTTTDGAAQNVYGLGISVPQFKKKFLKSHEEQEKFIFKKKTCPFLSDNLCANYSHRPKDCRSYPHLHKEGFVLDYGALLNTALSAR